MDDVVQNAVIRELFRISELTNCVPENDMVNILYEGTPEGDPARRLLVDLWVNWARATEPCVEDFGDNLTLVFLKDLIIVAF